MEYNRVHQNGKNCLKCRFEEIIGFICPARKSSADGSETRYPGPYSTVLVLGETGTGKGLIAGDSLSESQRAAVGAPS